MQQYQAFGVYALHDNLPVFTDRTEAEVLRLVDRKLKMNVLQRDGAHYVVRVLNQIGYVAVEDVTSSHPSESKFAAGGRRQPAYGVVGAPASSYASANARELAASGFVPADFGTRLVGFIIDYVLVVVVTLLAGGALVYALVPESEAQEPNTGLILLIYGGLFAAGFSYTWLMDAIGGTVGKLIVGIQVVDDETGRAPGLGKAFVRTIVRLVSGIPFYLGFVWMIWDRDSKTWHDKAAGTSVVKYR